MSENGDEEEKKEEIPNTTVARRIRAENNARQLLGLTENEIRYMNMLAAVFEVDPTRMWEHSVNDYNQNGSERNQQHQNNNSNTRTR
jgi:hypothetical protein